MRYADTTINPEAALRDLEHPDSRARVRAVDALSRAGDGWAERAGPALCRLLHDPEPDVRYTAALSLGELRFDGALEPLLAMVDGDGHPMPRQAAVIALGLLGDRRAGPVLKRALQQGPADVRFQATTSLVQADPERALAPLKRALSDEDPEVRGSAIAALGDLGDPKAAGALLGPLDDSQPGLRLEAAVALSRLGDRRGTPVLCQALYEGQQQHLAAEHLYRCPDPEAIEPMLDRLGRWLTPTLVKVWLAAALCRLDHPEGRPALLRLLQSRRLMVKGLAIQLLGELHTPWAEDALKNLAATPAGARWQEEIKAALTQ